MDNQCTYSSWRLTRDPSSFGKGPVIELFPKYLQPRTSPTNELQSQQAIYNMWSPKSMHIHVPLIFKWTALNICNHSSVQFGKARKWWKVNWRLAHRNWRFLMLEIVGGNWPTKPQWSILLRSTIQVLLNHIQHFDLISAPELLKKSLSIGMLCSKVETLTKRKDWSSPAPHLERRPGCQICCTTCFCLKARYQCKLVLRVYPIFD